MHRILIVLPNNVSLDGLKSTAGFWFSEFVHFYTIVKLQQFSVDIATPLGGEVIPDTLSTKRFFLDKEADAYYFSKDFMQRFKATLSLDSIHAKDYQAVYIVGGFASFHSYTHNERLLQVMRKVFTSGGLIATTGFGVIALLKLTSNDCDLVIDRKQITGMSILEETLLGVRKVVPVHLQEEMKNHNAFYSKAFFPLTSYTIKDGRIITGENANSARAVAWQLVYALKAIKP